VIESSSSASAASREEEKKKENKKKNKKDFIEDLWVGKKIMIGSGEDNNNIVLKVTSRCTRCVMITLPQGDLPNDLGILRTVVKYNQVTAGVYASVHQGGIIRRGDPVQIEEEEE
jgi:MOSC domain-containing protein YiiM